MIEPEPLQQVDRTYVRLGNRKLSYFAGCDYFRLASHPQVLAALMSGLKRYGLNVAASRLTTGNHVLYGQLEQELADFFEAENATLVSSGYLANLVAAQALAGSFSHALLDDNAHPSLSDAARFLECPVVQFKHRDAEALAQAVRRCGPGAKIILLTDGMFSRDGAAAPLEEYLAVLPKDAWLMVDDAHGAGVLGRTGQGTLEHAQVRRARIVQTITLSKAFGVYGGAILATAALRRRILERSLLFVGSTPLPLPLANAARESVRLLRRDKPLRARLTRNGTQTKESVRRAGVPLADMPGPIIPIFPESRASAQKLKRRLLAAGIHPPFIQYPGGPPSGYFRFVISSEHTPEQLERLVKALTVGHCGRKE
jgi:7-keto-8-aminopelargonate synthetase-like enzyme